LARRGDRSSAG